ncbi:MAG: phosphomannomutase [Candidatus Marinimicrobia bacterium]|nr:phosphomannomutase [Candidatus Neomarinimicrobiota bacterium]|tara:strand:+ start:215 stop:1579 length:1365 start_codon:yes stop_codon:yes gene_type:complete
MNLNQNIFREYDIRGVVTEDFQKNVVESLGKAFGTYIIKKSWKTISVSGDIRETSLELKEAFINGLLTTGVEVIDIGIVPTPTNYFSMYFLNTDAAVQITGSHNPPEFNGFKFSCKKESFYGIKIQELKKIIINGKYIKGNGTVKIKNITNDYIKMLKSKIQLNKKMKLIIDCGNACGCLTAPQTLKEIGVDVKELYCDVDSNFPNHHPDPTVDSNLNDIIAEIKKGDFDLGIAFDGDADRIVAIDEKGQIIRSDNLMALFLPEIITEQNKKVIFDVKCSEALEKMITHYGGEPLMWKTGHSLIKDKMKKEKVTFAGEMSGHIFFADDYYGYDDALYVGLRLLKLLSNTDKKLSELTEKIPKYYSTPEMRLNCKNDDEKFKITKKAISYFKKKYDCIIIDGVRIKFKDGWGLVRSSNTQPVIVCRFEAQDSESLKKIKNFVLNKLNEFGDIDYE